MGAGQHALCSTLLRHESLHARTWHADLTWPGLEPRPPCPALSLEMQASTSSARAWACPAPRRWLTAGRTCQRSCEMGAGTLPRACSGASRRHAGPPDGTRSQGAGAGGGAAAGGAASGPPPLLRPLVARPMHCSTAIQRECAFLVAFLQALITAYVDRGMDSEGLGPCKPGPGSLPDTSDHHGKRQAPGALPRPGARGTLLSPGCRRPNTPPERPPHAS